jgi:site-specific recombinase XerD
MKRPTIKIYLRTDQINKDGSSTVILRITIDRKKKEYSTNVTTNVKNWNEIKFIKNSDPNHLQNNKILHKLISKANSIIDDCFFSNKRLSINEFDLLFRSNGGQSKNFFEFIQTLIDESINDFSPTTIIKYQTELRKLKRFIKNIEFEDITESFISKFKMFCVNLGNNENTIKKSMAFIKQALNKAINKGLIKENVFSKIKIGAIVGNREHLNRFEVEQLENIYESELLNKYQKNVLKYFLFSCFTGLRYSDLKRLKNSDIILVNESNIDFWVVDIIQGKTDSLVRIPVLNRAKKYLSFGHANLPAFRVIASQPANRVLKEIITIAGIKKKITFHCARHTFATIGLELGISLAVVSKLLGHTDVKTTMIYTSIGDKLKYDCMQKFEKE